jgi:hypothetical protein
MFKNYAREMIIDIKSDFKKAKEKIGKGEKATLSMWEIPVSSMTVFRAVYFPVLFLNVFFVYSFMLICAVWSLFTDEDQRRFLREGIKEMREEKHSR